MTIMTPNASGHEHLGALASRYVDVASLPWVPTRFKGVELKVLMEDKETGLMTALTRFALTRVTLVPMRRGDDPSTVLASATVLDETQPSLTPDAIRDGFAQLQPNVSQKFRGLERLPEWQRSLRDQALARGPRHRL